MASKEDTAKSTQDGATNASSSKQESCEQHPETESSEYIGDSKKRSKVWLHFVNTDNLDKAKCIYCGVLISCRTRHGPTTSAMLKHISRCKSMPREEADSESNGKMLKQSTLDDSIGSKVPSHTPFSQPASRKALVEMVIMDELPFRFVEHRGFRRFVNVLQPRFEIPCRKTITKDCLRFYEDEKGKLRKFFRNYKGSISLTTDCWTSIQNLSYMCLTAHYVDEKWKLHKRVINFCVVDNHAGETISKMVEKCCSFWGIRRVFTITVDNASSNDLALKYLKKKLTSWGTTVLGGEFLHMRCAAHILSLIVKDSLQEAHGSIFRIRSAVRYVRSSPGRLKRFKECLEIQKVESQAGLCLDVETRWNSTFLMLQAAESLKKGFDMIEFEDDKYIAELSRICNAPPSESDWSYASALTGILQYFYDATVNISGSKYVTGNTYMKEIFGVGWMIVKMDTAEDKHKQAMAEKMRLKFYKYWGNIDNTNMLIYVAAILNPRYKMRWVKWMIECTYPSYEANCLVAKIIDALNRLFAYYLYLHTTCL